MTREHALPGVGAVGRALKDSVAPITAAFVERLGADAALPQAAKLAAVDLEDHTASLLVDIALSLIATSEADIDVTDLLRDGSRIQHLVAKLHGAQRARYGWDEQGVRREFRILIEEVESAVRRAAPPGAQLDAGLDLVRRALEQALAASLAEWRAAR